MPDFTYEGLDRFKEDINRLPEIAAQAAVPAMEDTLHFLRGKIPQYPDAAPIIPPDGVSFLKTDAQKAWFFASARKGELKGWTWIDGHPEKTESTRTMTLDRRETFKTTVDQDTSTGSVTGEIGTNLGYAPWVVGPDFPGEVINGRQMYQARVHVDRWWQFDDVLLENITEGWEVFDEKFAEEFSKAMNTAVGGTNGI